MKKRKPERALLPGAMHVTVKGPVREAPAAPVKGAMYVTTKGPIASLPARKTGGRPRRTDVAPATVKAEKKRRIKAGENASQLSLARHFGVCEKTISRRLRK
jgi:hypothetical protein